MFTMRSTATVLLALFVCLSSATAAEEFKPKLDKVVVNGQVLYTADGNGAENTVEVDPTKPAQVQCTFVNIGDQFAEDRFMVFLHIGSGDQVISSDYSPEMPTTQWRKDRPVIDVKAIDLSAFMGRSVELFIGLYHGADRFSLINTGLDYQQRLPVGTLKIGPGAKP